MPHLDQTQRNKAFHRLVEMHYKAKVGHLGGNLSCLDAILVLFHEILKPEDEFILSKGHSIGALYAALWSIGDLSSEDLDTFHANGTLLPGHTPIGGLRSTPFATGSLGHGFSLACGLSLGYRLQGLVGKVFCLTSDGEWQEGSTWEALIFAAHNKLNNLVILIDENGFQGFGSTKEVASLDQLASKLASFEVCISIVDGHNLDDLRAVISKAVDRTHIIVMKTVKGYGVESYENKMESHYLPPSEEQYIAALKQERK